MWQSVHVLQDFPYACDPGIEHHNIWCTKPLTQDEILDVVEQHRPAAEGWEILTFINPVELQSVRAVRNPFYCPGCYV
jgi:hypothetical protein